MATHRPTDYLTVLPGGGFIADLKKKQRIFKNIKRWKTIT